jgi:hypothetical protein
VAAARRAQVWLAIVLIAYLGIAATYNFATPIFEAPDEIYHYLYVRNLAEGNGLPRDPGRGSRVPAQEEAAQPPLYYTVAAALTFWAPRGDFNTISKANLAGSRGDPRTDGNKNLYLHGPDQGFPWRGEVLTVHLVRFTTTIWGALAVLLTYFSGRALVGRASVAVVAAAIVAFTPEFAFMSAAVSNDVAVAAAGALLLYQATRVCRDRPSRRGALALGLAGGMVVLTKPIAAGALALVAVALAVSARRSAQPIRQTVERFAIAGAGVLAVAGWWFAYNLLTYGSLMPLQSFLSRPNLFGEMPSAASFVSDLNGLRLSYWAMFGWFSIAVPDPFYRIFDLLTLLAVIGLAIQFARPAVGRFDTAKHFNWLALSLPLTLLATVLLGVFAYRLVVQDFHGRLLFGAASGIALLLSLGWSSLAWPNPGRAVAILIAAGLAASSAVFPWTVLRPAYRPPALLAQASAHPTSPLTARFGDEIRLLGVDLTSGARVQPGDDVPVTLYLQALRKPDADYMLFLKVVAPTGKVLAEVNSHPGHGAYPTSAWQPGPVLADRYQIHLPAGAAGPAVDRIVAGFYRTDTQTDLPTFDSSGAPLGTSIPLGTIVVPGPSDPKLLTGDTVTFREGSRDLIAFLGHTVSARAVEPGASLTGTIRFGALSPTSHDYTIFVHLERADRLLAQDDSPPLRGAFPTTYWRSGDLIEHHWRIDVPTDVSPGESALLVGWYDPASAIRLPTATGDAVQLETIQIE